MSSYARRDRDSYIDRTGGPAKAEERRKALMARQSGYRLAGERKRHGLTQAQLAAVTGVTPGRVSRSNAARSPPLTPSRYIEALGGRLGLVASFGDHNPYRCHQRSGLTHPPPVARQIRSSDVQPRIRSAA